MVGAEKQQVAGSSPGTGLETPGLHETDITITAVLRLHTVSSVSVGVRVVRGAEG